MENTELVQFRKVVEFMGEQRRLLSSVGTDDTFLDVYRLVLEHLKHLSPGDVCRIFANSSDKASARTPLVSPGEDLELLSLEKIETIVSDKATLKKTLEDIAVTRFKVPTGSIHKHTKDQLIEKITTLANNESAHNTIRMAIQKNKNSQCPSGKDGHNGLICEKIHAFINEREIMNWILFLVALQCLSERPICPACGGFYIVKNGLTRHGDQNHKCRACGRHFIDNAQENQISTDTISQIDKMLLERISMAGIARVTGVSESWLQRYVNKKFQDAPKQIDIVKKKGKLTIECDEMWSFVLNKENKQWVWLAIDAASREIVGVFVGPRSRKGANALWQSLPAVYRQCAVYYTDFLQKIEGQYIHLENRGTVYPFGEIGRHIWTPP